MCASTSSDSGSVRLNAQMMSCIPSGGACTAKQSKKLPVGGQPKRLSLPLLPQKRDTHRTSESHLWFLPRNLSKPPHATGVKNQKERQRERSTGNVRASEKKHLSEPRKAAARKTYRRSRKLERSDERRGRVRQRHRLVRRLALRERHGRVRAVRVGRA